MTAYDPEGIVRECVSCRRCYPSSVQFCRDCMIELVSIEMIPYLIDSRYQLQRVIAHGSTGVAFIAVEMNGKTGNDRPERVIKVVRASAIADPRANDRFHREAEIAIAFRHPNVAPILGSGTLPDASAFLVSEYIRGATLRHEMRRQKRLPINEAIRVIGGICDGLDTAHKAGLVHRDLKPESVILAHSPLDGEATIPTIVGFSFTRIAAGKPFVPGTTAKLQGQGQLPLRPDYISPEQFRGEEADLRSDIFSLGIIAYEMLTSTLPFSGKRVGDYGLSLLTQRPDSIRRANSAVNPLIEAEIMRALEKDPANRQQRARELKRNLIAAAQIG